MLHYFRAIIWTVWLNIQQPKIVYCNPLFSRLCERRFFRQFGDSFQLRFRNKMKKGEKLPKEESFSISLWIRARWKNFSCPFWNVLQNAYDILRAAIRLLWFSTTAILFYAFRRLLDMECDDCHLESQVIRPNWDSDRQILPWNQCQGVHSQHYC